MPRASHWYRVQIGWHQYAPGWWRDCSAVGGHNQYPQQSYHAVGWVEDAKLMVRQGVGVGVATDKHDKTWRFRARSGHVHMSCLPSFIMSAPELYKRQWEAREALLVPHITCHAMALTLERVGAPWRRAR